MLKPSTGGAIALSSAVSKACSALNDAAETTGRIELAVPFAHDAVRRVVDLMEGLESRASIAEALAALTSEAVLQSVSIAILLQHATLEEAACAHLADILEEVALRLAGLSCRRLCNKKGSACLNHPPVVSALCFTRPPGEGTKAHRISAHFASQAAHPRRSAPTSSAPSPAKRPTRSWHRT